MAHNVKKKVILCHDHVWQMSDRSFRLMTFRTTSAANHIEIALFSTKYKRKAKVIMDENRYCGKKKGQMTTINQRGCVLESAKFIRIRSNCILGTVIAWGFCSALFTLAPQCLG
eukprot:910142_1